MRCPYTLRVVFCLRVTKHPRHGNVITARLGKCNGCDEVPQPVEGAWKANRCGYRAQLVAQVARVLRSPNAGRKHKVVILPMERSKAQPGGFPSLVL